MRGASGDAVRAALAADSSPCWTRVMARWARALSVGELGEGGCAAWGGGGLVEELEPLAGSEEGRPPVKFLRGGKGLVGGAVQEEAWSE